MSKYSHLWYCVQCETLIRIGGIQAFSYHYVCSEPCLSLWRQRPKEDQRQTVVLLEKKGLQ